MYAYRIKVPTVWTNTEIDIGDLQLIQVYSHGTSVIELLASATTPTTEQGIYLKSGDSVNDTSIDSIDTSGDVWVRRLGGSSTWVILNTGSAQTPIECENVSFDLDIV